MDTDEELYLQARDGSTQAFTSLYNRYEKPLFGFIYAQLKNRQDSEEVFHDAMLGLVRGDAVDFKSGGLCPWLYKVAYHLSLNHLRAKQRHLRKISFAGQPDVVPGSDEQLIALETNKALAESEQGLSPQLRSVYDLRRQGLSHELIAERLKIPIGTVKSRTNAVVIFLRKEISKWNARS